MNGLFDTYFACQILYSGKSLAFLLSRFVDFDADKQYQLADWRMRPIPEEMMYYARSDTHYLLYIYDRVRNDLVDASDRSDPDKDFIARALKNSQELSLSRHEHPDFNEENGDGSRGWYNYVLKHSHLSFSSEQFAVFRALWKWRDTTARKEDESPNFVLGTHNVADVARVNPPDAKALHSMLPMTAPLARSRVSEIWALVQETKAQNGPSLLHFFTSLAPEALGKNGAHKLAKARSKLPELDGEVTVGRLPKSQLFGNMPISSRWEESQARGGKDAPIPFPWQRFIEGAEEGFDDDGTGAVEQTAQDVLEVVEAPAPQPEDVDEEFTLRRGKKRKSSAVEEAPSSSSDDEAEPDSDEEMAEDADTSEILTLDDAPKPGTTPANKKARKRERREAKEQAAEEAAQAKAERKARKAEKKQKGEQGKKQKQFEAVPFDYSKAGPVMHAPRGPKTPEEGLAARKRTFDPYSKTGDEPLKGARKAMPVKGERSATFKK